MGAVRTQYRQARSPSVETPLIPKLTAFGLCLSGQVYFFYSLIELTIWPHTIISIGVYCAGLNVIERFREPKKEQRSPRRRCPKDHNPA